MKSWLFLGVAIFGEVVATSALKSTDGFSKLAPSFVVVVGYVIAFYFLSLALRSIPVGVAYAIWAGRSSSCGYCLVGAWAKIRFCSYFRHGFNNSWCHCYECIFKIGFALMRNNFLYARPNKSLKGVRIRSLDSLNRRMLRILRAACVCPLALRYIARS